MNRSAHAALLFLSLCLLCGASPALARADAQGRDFAIVNARIMTAGPAGEIARGAVIVRDGKIAAVGAEVTAPAGMRAIDAAGAIVTPGLVAADAALGAVEVTSLGDDRTAVAPDLSAAFDISYALDPDSLLIPAARLGGVTASITTPEAGSGDDGNEAHDGAGGDDGGPAALGLFAGQAAAIDLRAGATDPLLRARVAMVAPLGARGAKIAGGARGAEFVALKAAFDDARFYARNRSRFDQGDSRALSLSRVDLEALIPVVEGRMPLLVTVSKASDITAALKLAREENIRIVLNGAEEGWRVADAIAAAKVPVLLNPLADLPADFERIGSRLDNAARLDAAGVMVVIRAASGGAHRVRETRTSAGNAVAYGLPWGKALAAVTINPARVFGVADRVGSIEPGKDADLVIWSGDPFEPLSLPTAVFIRGEAQPMASRGTALRDRYRTLSDPYPPAYR